MQNDEKKYSAIVVDPPWPIKKLTNYHDQSQRKQKTFLTLRIMNNLEPRAKIGDVVIVNHPQGVKDQYSILSASYTDESGWSYILSRTFYRKEWLTIEEKYILKNLTTNISYE